MKIISDKKNTKGKRRVLVELDDFEEIMPINEKAHYKLGYPVDDVVAGHILASTEAVVWCSAQQGWIA